jgi:hypothetical protein
MRIRSRMCESIASSSDSWAESKKTDPENKVIAALIRKELESPQQ